MILSAMITAPITGALVDKYGPRRVALISIPFYATALGIFGYLSHTLTTFYLAWLLISFIGAGTLPITWTKNVNFWFDKNRGLALGICLMGTGIAATLVPVYVVSLISFFGWKQAYVFLGLTVLVIAFPSTFFFLGCPRTITAMVCYRKSLSQKALTAGCYREVVEEIFSAIIDFG